MEKAKVYFTDLRVKKKKTGTSDQKGWDRTN